MSVLPGDRLGRRKNEAAAALPAWRLELLGWAPFFDAAFEPYRDQGLVPARVASQHRGSYVLLAQSGELQAEVSGALRHAALTSADLPVAGDWVAVRPARELVALSHKQGRRAIVHAVLPRRTAFARRTAGDRADEQVLAANVDVAFLVAGLDGEFRPRRLERYLTTAWEGGAQPVVVLTKSDLCSDVGARTAEAEAVAGGSAVHAVSAVTGEGIAELRPYLDGNRTGALLGSSGVGKSTLVNQLCGRELLATASLRADGRGRHTTAHRQLVPLPGGGLILDTPGLRELQLWDSGEGLAETFGDIESLVLRCRFGDCLHDTEPGCAVKAALADGSLTAERLDSYRKLQRELQALEARGDPLARAKRLREMKIGARGRRRADRRDKSSM